MSTFTQLAIIAQRIRCNARRLRYDNHVLCDRAILAMEATEAARLDAEAHLLAMKAKEARRRVRERIGTG